MSGLGLKCFGVFTVKLSTAYIVPSQKPCPMRPAQPVRVKSFLSIRPGTSLHIQIPMPDIHIIPCSFLSPTPILYHDLDVLSSTPALKARQFISNWIFLNRQNSSFTYRNNSLILDELAVYDEIFSIFAFKSSWNVFTKLNIKWPFSIRGRTISVLLLIRFHTLWNQNRNVDEIKLSEGSTGIYALSAE